MSDIPIPKISLNKQKKLKNLAFQLTEISGKFAVNNEKLVNKINKTYKFNADINNLNDLNNVNFDALINEFKKNKIELSLK